MSSLEACAREAARLDKLEPKPRPSTKDSYNHGLLGDPRRYSSRYRTHATIARGGATTDNPLMPDEDPDLPTFNSTFDIASNTVMFARATPIWTYPSRWRTP